MRTVKSLQKRLEYATCERGYFLIQKKKKKIRKRTVDASSKTQGQIVRTGTRPERARKIRRENVRKKNKSCYIFLVLLLVAFFPARSDVVVLFCPVEGKSPTVTYFKDVRRF